MTAGNPPDFDDTPPRDVVDQLRKLNDPQRLLDGWLSKARYAHQLAPGEPWPAWSTGEVLAVALILDDREELTAMDYTRDEALQRLRYDIGQPTIAAAADVFDELRRQLTRSGGDTP